MSDVIQWINEKIIDEGNKIAANDIDEVRDFVLLWNLFEDLLCNNNANMNKIDNLIDRFIDILDENKYQEIYEYFHNRYKDDGTKFKALKLRRPHKNLVKKILDDEFVDKNNKLKFIMAIIYRYRNNLFHGEKDMKKIKFQKENFEQTNKFLMYFIETCKDN